MTSPHVTTTEFVRDDDQRAAAADRECPICGEWVMTGELFFEFPTDDQCQRWLCRL